MLDELCERLRLEQVDVVANDTGGAVAQPFAEAIRQYVTLRELLASYLGPFVPDQGKGLERFLTASSAAELMAVEPMLAELDAPAQVAWGTADIFFEPSWAERLRDMIPGVERVTLVPEAMLFWSDERAADLVPLLRDFWEVHT